MQFSPFFRGNGLSNDMKNVKLSHQMAPKMMVNYVTILKFMAKAT